MTAVITVEDVRHLARLSRLSFSEAELARLAGELSEVLRYFETLDRINVDGVAPMSHPLADAHHLDEDEIGQTLGIDEVQRNAPSMRGRLFHVPRVVDKVRE